MLSIIYSTYLDLFQSSAVRRSPLLITNLIRALSGGQYHPETATLQHLISSAPKRCSDVNCEEFRFSMHLKIIVILRFLEYFW